MRSPPSLCSCLSSASLDLQPHVLRLIERRVRERETLANAIIPRLQLHALAEGKERQDKGPEEMLRVIYFRSAASGESALLHAASPCLSLPPSLTPSQAVKWPLMPDSHERPLLLLPCCCCCCMSLAPSCCHGVTVKTRGQEEGHRKLRQ